MQAATAQQHPGCEGLTRPWLVPLCPVLSVRYRYVRYVGMGMLLSCQGLALHTARTWQLPSIEVRPQQGMFCV